MADETRANEQLRIIEALAAKKITGSTERDRANVRKTARTRHTDTDSSGGLPVD